MAFTGSAYIPVAKSYQSFPSPVNRASGVAAPAGFATGATASGSTRSSGSAYLPEVADSPDTTWQSLAEIAKAGGQVSKGIGVGRWLTGQADAGELGDTFRTAGYGVNSALGPLNTYLAATGPGSDARRALGIGQGLAQSTQGIAGLGGFGALSSGAGMAGGLLGIGQGALSLAEGGNEGAAAVDIASGALSMTPAAPLGWLLQAGKIGHSFAGQSQVERRQRDQQMAQMAGGVYGATGKGLQGVGDMNSLQASLDQPATPGGPRQGDVLLSILQAVQVGNAGWDDPTHFATEYGWGPREEYAGLADLLTSLGYAPTADLNGTNVAELVGATTGNIGNPAQGVNRWRGLMDALAPLGAGRVNSAYAPSPAAQSAYDARLAGDAERRAAEEDARRATLAAYYSETPSWEGG